MSSCQLFSATDLRRPLVTILCTGLWSWKLVRNRVWTKTCCPETACRNMTSTSVEFASLPSAMYRLRSMMSHSTCIKHEVKWAIMQLCKGWRVCRTFWLEPLSAAYSTCSPCKQSTMALKASVLLIISCLIQRSYEPLWNHIPHTYTKTCWVGPDFIFGIC